MITNRTLARRNDGNVEISLLWWVDNKGINRTEIKVKNPDREMQEEVPAEMSWFHYTHAGAKFPEMWPKRKVGA